MKFVISTKSGKAYSANSETPLFAGKRIGDTVGLDEIGLTGFEAKVTGGSGNQGFPMHASVQGNVIKKIFTPVGVGFRSATRKGEKRRVSVRGNTIADDIAQVNLVITKDGSVTIDSVLAKKAPSAEETMSAKERLIKESLKSAGSEELGGGVKKKGRH